MTARVAFEKESDAKEVKEVKEVEEVEETVQEATEVEEERTPSAEMDGAEVAKERSAQSRASSEKGSEFTRRLFRV